jgi:hypothetical protein
MGTAATANSVSVRGGWQGPSSVLHVSLSTNTLKEDVPAEAGGVQGAALPDADAEATAAVVDNSKQSPSQNPKVRSPSTRDAIAMAKYSGFDLLVPEKLYMDCTSRHGNNVSVELGSKFLATQVDGCCTGKMGNTVCVYASNRSQ